MQRQSKIGSAAMGRLAAVAALCAAAALAGCASPPTRFYTVEPVLPAAVSPYPGPPLQVRAVRVPPAWDRTELVREVAPGQLQVREFDHWAAPLGRILQQTLTQDLAARLPPGAVMYPQAARGADAAELTVDILSLRIDGRLATVQLAWAIRSSSTAAWRSSPLTLTVAVAGESGDATALALSGLLGQLADAMVASVVTGGPAASLPPVAPSASASALTAPPAAAARTAEHEERIADNRVFPPPTSLHPWPPSTPNT